MSWVLTAKVGDKVQCVDGSWESEQICTAAIAGISLPQQDGIYTIREVISFRLGIDFLLEEICNPIVAYADTDPREQAFAAEIFRPVQSRPTDISVFHDILKSVSETVGEDA